MRTTQIRSLATFLGIHNDSPLPTVRRQVAACIVKMIRNHDGLQAEVESLLGDYKAESINRQESFTQCESVTTH